MEEKFIFLSKNNLIDEQNSSINNKNHNTEGYSNTEMNTFNNFFFDFNRPFKSDLNNIYFNNDSGNSAKMNEEFILRSLKVNQNENESPSSELLKLDKNKNEILFTKNEIKSIEKLSKQVFKTKNFGFLKKKKKKIIKKSNNDNSKSDMKIKFSTIKEDKQNNFIDKRDLSIKTFTKNFENIVPKLHIKNIEYKKNFYLEKNSELKNRKKKYNHELSIKTNHILFKTQSIPFKQDETIINLSLVSSKIRSNKVNNLEQRSADTIKAPKKNKIKITDNSDNIKEETKATQKIKIKWTEDEDKKLIKVKQDFPYLTWLQISQFFEKRSKVDCMNRYLKVIDPKLKKGKWTKEEDEILKNWVGVNGDKNWFNLVKSNLLSGRNCKQIRDRWVNCLCPQLKVFEWDEIKEKILLEKFLIYGTSWTKISASIPNTSENFVKNKFYSMLRKTANKSLNRSKLNKATCDKKIINISIDSSNNALFNDKNTKEFDNDFIKEVKNKNKKNKIIEQDITDTYMNLDYSNTKTNTISHSTANNKLQTSVLLDKSEFPLLMEIGNEEADGIIKIKKRKKNNYSLDSLMNFLPLLLKEKGISYEKSVESEKKKSAFNLCSESKRKDKLNKIIRDESEHNDEKEKENIRMNFINSIKKPFDKKKEMVRKELINKIKRISNSKLNNINFEDKPIKVGSFINNNEFSDRNFWERDNFMMNSYNNLNNNIGNINNLNNKLQNFILSNNNLSNLNDSFISNGDDLLDNIFSNNRINLNFSNSDFQNKNLSNSLNFSDLLDLDNNNLLNNSNQSFNRNNSYNNILDNNNSNPTNNSNPEPKLNSNQTFGRLNRMKSSIMLNLQLNLLNKIVEKIKNNYVQKFFLNFKNNTLFKVPNGISYKNQLSENQKES